MRIFVLFICFIILITACKKTIDMPIQKDFTSDLAYFGLKKGRFIEYDVTHIIHDDEVDIHDTIKFRLKTIIGDTITDNEGRKANKYIRLLWNNSNDTWEIKDIWTAIIAGKNAELTDENQKIIKLTFPINKSIFWNPSIFSTVPSENYIYDKIHIPLNFNNHLFDSTVTVLQNNYFTLVDYKFQTETYAKNIGLISKYYKNLRIKNFDTLQVKKGEEWFYTITKFGDK
jgi:hypothetical protein